MIKSVSFVPRYVAEDHIFNDEYAVISVTDNDQEDALIQGETDLLRLKFLDLEAAINHPNFKENYLFDEHKAREIISYVKRIHELPNQKKMFVHCEAGVSRSAAIALFIHFFTQCEFENFSNANYANKLIIKILEDISNTSIMIPPKPEINTENLIFLFDKF